jgi:hypothetical protein
MHRLNYCSILLLITLLVTVGALISFLKVSVANVSGKIPKLNVSKNLDIYTKDYPENKKVRNTLIIIISIIIVFILHNLFIYKPFRQRVVPSVIGLLLSLSIIITAIVGIVFFSSMDLKNGNSLGMKNILFEFSINTNNKNIILINTLTYMAYVLAIVSSLFCGSINIAYFANK